MLDFLIGKLILGVNETRIIRDIRGVVVNDGKEERHHLVTRHDVNNVKIDIGSNVSTRRTIISSDELSVKLWVKAMEHENIILCFKEQNSEHEVLNFNDFFLAFMFPIQLKMLSEFGGDRICIDSTHGTTGYDFELVTVMVVDEFEEGFPVAFCLTSSVK